MHSINLSFVCDKLHIKRYQHCSQYEPSDNDLFRQINISMFESRVVGR